MSELITRLRDKTRLRENRDYRMKAAQEAQDHQDRANLQLGLIRAELAVFFVAGLTWFIEVFVSTKLDHRYWQCTESALIDGRAECVKWEMKK